MPCLSLTLPMVYRGKPWQNGRGGGRGQGGNNNYNNNNGNNNGGGGNNNGLGSAFMSQFSGLSNQWTSYMEYDMFLKRQAQEGEAQKNVEAHFKKKFGRRSSSSDSSSTDSHKNDKKYISLFEPSPEEKQ